MNAKNRFAVVFLCVLAIWIVLNPRGSLIAHCQGLRAIDVVPDEERRSSIHEVDGYAYLSEDMTVKETRKVAFSNAKRQAVEMAETYIQSKSKVKDGVLAYDLITSDAQGAVSILEQKDHGIEGNNRYHVWIKAEVKYELKPQNPATAKTEIMDVNAPLTVKVWSEKKEYAKGEFIRLFIQGNRDFYARIVNVAADGRLLQLLPNKYSSSSFFKGGKTYIIPGRKDQFNLKVSPPFGREKVIVYASEVPISRIPLEAAGAGLGYYKDSRDALGRDARGIVPVPAGSGSSSAEFYEAAWNLRTKPE